MSNKSLCLIFLSLIISTILICRVRADNEKSESSSDIIYFEDYVSAIEDETESRFHKAREYFFKNDYEAAAKEIHKGAVFLRLESGWATKEGKGPLIASARELDILADEVEKGEVASVKDLDQAFSRAHFALARHYRLRASESEVKKAYEKLGTELKAAAKHLNHALLWSGDKIESGLREIRKDVQIFEEKLVEGGKWVHDEANRIIKYIDKEIEKFNKKTEPEKKQTDP
ncbi:MAG: hypothetical protein ACMUIU_00110 [bacterium]